MYWFGQGRTTAFLTFPARNSEGCRLGSHSSSQVSQLLTRWSQGDGSAREKLVPLVYEELRRLAQDSLDKSLKADPCILMPDAKKAKWISFELQSGDGLQEILTAGELEAFIRLDVKMIYARVQSGRIPYVRMGSSIRFFKREILAWLEKRHYRP